MPITVPDMDVVHVAVGVVLNAEGRILIAQRQPGQHLAGKWEFPGGKIEEGESCEQALARELEEETAIQSLNSKPLMFIEHSYKEKTVALDVHLVTEFNGQARGCEGQALRWVTAAELSDYCFPEANRKIVETLQKQAEAKSL